MALAAAAAAAAVAGAFAPQPEPDAGGAGAAALAPVEEAPAEPQEDVKAYVTEGDTMYGIRLSDLPHLDEKELAKWYRRLSYACAECWSPEECENMSIILEAISKQLRSRR